MSNNKDRINDYAHSPNMTPGINSCRAERVLIKKSTKEKDSKLNEVKIKQMHEDYKPKS